MAKPGPDPQAAAIPTPARLAAALGGHLPVAGQKIGLLGGSFNPGHQGHRHISLEALKLLGLDEVWWLVSPQNPLKPPKGMAPLAERLETARAAARHPRIRITAIERVLDTVYTAETLGRLVDRFPRVRFVWIMGADNLTQVDRWQDWQEIFHLTPVAVFDRPTYSLRALAAKAARRFARERLSGRRIAGLAAAEPPAWSFLYIRLNPLSATDLRNRSGRNNRAMETKR
ncbi:MAG: nicotinate-nucleotide adenylyltransferase [Rhodovibrionaceae bacterium]